MDIGLRDCFRFLRVGVWISFIVVVILGYKFVYNIVCKDKLELVCNNKFRIKKNISNSDRIILG